MRRGFTVVELLVCLAAVAILAAVLVPNWRARAQGQLTDCKSNLKNIGTACEMYSTDNSGRFPVTLPNLTPGYLKTLPTCPSAGVPTYAGHGYTSASNPDAYTVVCLGLNHGGADMPANYPQYCSTTVFLER